MSRYRLQRMDDGTEYTRECDKHFLLSRAMEPTETLKKGQLFRFISRLDPDDWWIEKLVEIKPKVVATTLSTWGRGFRSDAMGINPEDRIDQLNSDAARGLRGVDYDPNTGEAIFSSRGAYRKYCEANGFFDRNGGYSGAQKLDERECEIRGISYELGSEEADKTNAPIFMDYDPREE